MLKLPIAILAAGAALVPVSSAAAKAPSLKTVFHRYDRAAGRDVNALTKALAHYQYRVKPGTPGTGNPGAVIHAAKTYDRELARVARQARAAAAHGAGQRHARTLIIRSTKGQRTWASKEIAVMHDLYNNAEAKFSADLRAGDKAFKASQRQLTRAGKLLHAL